MTKATQDFNHGYHDGKASAGFKNPIHNNWPAGPHFNKDYEAGYWKGYKEAENNHGA